MKRGYITTFWRLKKVKAVDKTWWANSEEANTISAAVKVMT